MDNRGEDDDYGINVGKQANLFCFPQMTPFLLFFISLCTFNLNPKF